MLPSPDGGARFGSVGWVFRLGAVQGRPLRLMQVPLTGASVQISEQLGLWIASTAPLARITDRFAAAVHRFAEREQVRGWTSPEGSARTT